MNYSERDKTETLAYRLISVVHNVNPQFPDRLKEARKLYRELGKSLSLIDPKGKKG